MDALAQKHLGAVAVNNATSINPVNTVSGPKELDPSPYTEFDDSIIPKPNISNTPDEGIFTKASYDQEGVIKDNNLPTVVDVSHLPTLRIHNIYPNSQILSDPKSNVQTRKQVQQLKGAHAFISFMHN